MAVSKSFKNAYHGKYLKTTGIYTAQQLWLWSVFIHRTKRQIYERREKYRYF